MQYTQCVREIRDLKTQFPLVLDPEMPTQDLRYIGPVYGPVSGYCYASVPIDASVGERIICSDIWDSATRMQVYQIDQLDTVVGEESAPHYPLAPVRKAVVQLVHTARSHLDRMP